MIPSISSVTSRSSQPPADRVGELDHKLSGKPWRRAEFLMVKPGQKEPDMFISARFKTYPDAHAETALMVTRLADDGYAVKRAKIEATIVDMRFRD